MQNHDLIATFSIAAALGVVLMIIANRLKVSAIVILLVGGVLAGPEGLGLIHPEKLGSGLSAIIAIAVGIILFEGGLTLDVKHFRQISREVSGMLTKGVLVTWLSSALLIYLFFGRGDEHFTFGFCLFAASLIIVTGPTVVGPLLSRIRAKRNLHHILHWEGVLIDPIGVFIALMCFDWIVSSGNLGIAQAIGQFLGRFGTGLLIGTGFGIMLNQVLARNWIPDEYLNITVLIGAILNYALADMILHESGLLSVTVAGLYLGYKRPPKLDRIIAYKMELKDLMIGLLFVLLAASLKLERFTEYGSSLLWIVAGVMFLVRPLNIFISTYNGQLNLREKLFLSWIAPRGIVAASMASLSALKLTANDHPHANFLETFTYSVIAGTVLFQGFSARWVGKLLGVVEPRPTGWVIVGAHRVGREIAAFLRDHGLTVVLLDTNPRHIRDARRDDIEAICDNAMTIELDQSPLFYGVGNFLAITENQDLNILLCQRWSGLLDKPNLYRWSRDEHEDLPETVGSPIWAGFYLKELLARDFEEPLHIHRKQIPVEDLESEQDVLAIHFQGTTEIIPPKSGQGMAEVLVIGTAVAATGLPVRARWVLFSEDETLPELYKRMLARLSETVPELDCRAILSELIEREQEFSSLLGHGITLPHAYSQQLDESVLLVARAKPALPCAHSGEDISLVLMLLSPENRQVDHLEVLSKIAKLIVKPEIRNQLIATSSERELFRILKTGHV